MVLVPAVDALLPTTMTRMYNTITTFLATELERPCYLQIYKDVLALDHALANATTRSTFHQGLEWFFMCWEYGQHQLLGEGEVLGPDAFGLGSAFDLTDCCRPTLNSMWIPSTPSSGMPAMHTAEVAAMVSEEFLDCVYGFNTLLREHLFG